MISDSLTGTDGIAGEDGVLALSAPYLQDVDRSPEAIRTIQQKLVNQCARGEIRPLIRDVYQMDELVSAMESLRSRGTVGKVVIAM